MKESINLNEVEQKEKNNNNAEEHKHGHTHTQKVTYENLHFLKCIRVYARECAGFIFHKTKKFDATHFLTCTYLKWYALDSERLLICRWKKKYADYMQQSSFFSISQF